MFQFHHIDISLYLKGYTTVIDEKHRLYPIMKSRKIKYEKWHKDNIGGEISFDITDGTHNHIVIAVPESSDKNKFIKDKDGKSLLTENFGEQELYDQFPKDENGKPDFEADLSENEATKLYDKMFYEKIVKNSTIEKRQNPSLIFYYFYRQLQNQYNKVLDIRRNGCWAFLTSVAQSTLGTRVSSLT